MGSGMIFITGCTGFIGSHVVVAALKAGYRVRLGSKKDTQISLILTIVPTFVEQIEFVLVPTSAKSNAFQEVLDGVDYVFHLASSMPGKGDNFEEDYLKPAVNETESMLLAAKNTPSVKMVIILSSMLSIIPMGGTRKPGLEISGTLSLETYDERPSNSLIESHNLDLTIDMSKPFPPGRSGAGLKYQASKILAHKATQEFMYTHQPTFTLSTLHPTFVIGHSLVQRRAEEIDGINAWFWNSLRQSTPLFPSTCVDVRDVAEAHIKVLESDVRSGTAFLLSGPSFGWDDVVDFVQEEYDGDVEVKLKGPFAKPIIADTTRAERILGIEWRSMEDMIRSVVDQQLGLLKSNF